MNVIKIMIKILNANENDHNIFQFQAFFLQFDEKKFTDELLRFSVKMSALILMR